MTDKESTTWYLTVGASRYYYNYRHTADSIAFHALHHRFDQSPLPNHNILSWDAANIINHPNNNFPGEILLYSDESTDDKNKDLLADMQVSMTGESVALQLFQDTLLLSEEAFMSKYGEVTSTFPDALDSPSMYSGSKDNNNNEYNLDRNRIVLFLSGHGGDEFFKFHDYEEMDAMTLAQWLYQMFVLRRYSKLLLVLDTCQAASMSHYLSPSDNENNDGGVPNIIFVASSSRGENSYAAPAHEDLGLSNIDRFSAQLLSLLDGNKKFSRNDKNKNNKYKDTSKKKNLSLSQLDRYFSYEELFSHVYTTVTSPISSSSGNRNNSRYDAHNIDSSDMNLYHWFSNSDTSVVSTPDAPNANKYSWQQFPVEIDAAAPLYSVYSSKSSDTDVMKDISSATSTNSYKTHYQRTTNGNIRYESTALSWKGVASNVYVGKILVFASLWLLLYILKR